MVPAKADPMLGAETTRTIRENFSTSVPARPASCYFTSSMTTAPLQILTVEDENAIAQVLALVLGGPASKVTRAVDGWEALIKIGVSERPFDLVITDHRMPRVGGLDLVRRLRTRKFDGKILVLSAHLSDEDIQAYEELEVDMMMSKPFDFQEIQNAVAVVTGGASIAA